MKQRLLAFVFGAQLARTMFCNFALDTIPRAMLLCRAWCCEVREDHNSIAFGRLERGFPQDFSNISAVQHLVIRLGPFFLVSILLYILVYISRAGTVGNMML